MWGSPFKAAQNSVKQRFQSVGPIDWKFSNWVYLGHKGHFDSPRLCVAGCIVSYICPVRSAASPQRMATTTIQPSATRGHDVDVRLAAVPPVVHVIVMRREGPHVVTLLVGLDVTDTTSTQCHTWSHGGELDVRLAATTCTSGHSVIRREGPHVVTWGRALGMHVAASHTTHFRYIF